jgi:hypothetical protein
LYIRGIYGRSSISERKYNKNIIWVISISRYFKTNSVKRERKQKEKGNKKSVKIERSTKT